MRQVGLWDRRPWRQEGPASGARAAASRTLVLARVVATHEYPSGEAVQPGTAAAAVPALVAAGAAAAGTAAAGLAADGTALGATAATGVAALAAGALAATGALAAAPQAGAAQAALTGSVADASWKAASEPAALVTFSAALPAKAWVMVTGGKPAARPRSARC